MQRRKQWGSRIATIALSAAMVFTMTPSVGAMAATTGSAKQVSGRLCEHHPEHTADCGYVAGTEGKPCTHVHTDDCYVVVEDCVHVHTAECYPEDNDTEEASPSNAKEPTECSHVCSEETGCTKEKLNCQHEHDEDCGYVAAEPGEPCGYVCEICNGENSNGLKQPVTEPEKTQYPECSSKKESSRLLDKLLVAEKIVTDPEADKESEEYQEALEQDEALWNHVDGCEICQGQLAEDGAYYKKFYGTATTQSGAGWTFDNSTGTLTISTNEATLILQGSLRPIGFDEVKNVVLTSEVTAIFPRAFNPCRQLVSVTIPNSVTSIGNDAFSDCPQLTNITIPESVTSMGSMVFANSSLKSIEFKSNTPPSSLNSRCFAGVPIAGNVTVPEGTEEAYETALTAAGLRFGVDEWTINAKTITFNANGGSVSPANAVTGTDGKLISLPTPTYSGKSFKGWFTAATGGTAVTTDTVYTADTTIYAQWTSKSSYRVTVNGSYATIPGAGSYETGETVSIHAGTRKGYTFTSWTGSVAFADADSAATTFVMPAGDVTVTAKWSNDGGGSTDGGSTGGSSSSGGSSGGGSSRSSSSRTYPECLPNNYKGATKILHSVRVPDYVVEGSWKAVGDGRWRLGSPDGTDYAGTWVPAYNPYANANNGQRVFDWFLFDAEGYLVTGWYTDEQGNTFYLNQSVDNTQGAMFFGWNIIDGKYYYFNEEPDGSRGKLYRNTTTPDGYYVDENGVWDGIQK